MTARDSNRPEDRGLPSVFVWVVAGLSAAALLFAPLESGPASTLARVLASHAWSHAAGIVSVGTVIFAAILFRKDRNRLALLVGAVALVIRTIELAFDLDGPSFNVAPPAGVTLSTVALLAFAAAGAFLLLKARFRDRLFQALLLSLVPRVAGSVLVALSEKDAGVLVSAWTLFFVADAVLCLAAIAELAARLDERAALHATVEHLGKDVKDSSGEVDRANQALAQQITRRQVAERQKNEFVSIVSHELRTPLTSIHGSLALLVSGRAGTFEAESEKLLEIAYRNSERLIRLINDILDIEKIESGRMSLNIAPVDLGRLVPQAIEANRAFAERFGVVFAVQKTLAEAWVRGDPGRLMQVLTNLLSNAAKFSPVDGLVEVALLRSGARIRVEVKDNGPGIPEEFQPRVFQKFAQSGVEPSRPVAGTGLGLSICKAIVERHGGDIGFATKPGLGTTFYFELPAREGRSSTAIQPLAEPARASVSAR